MLAQVRSGAIEFFALSGLILSTLVPVAPINGIGFAFKNYDQVWPAMDGSLGAHVRAAIDKAGLHAFEQMGDNGYRQMTSSTKPINTPDDLKGFKIRLPVSPLGTSMFNACGPAQGWLLRRVEAEIRRGGLEAAREPRRRAELKPWRRSAARSRSSPRNRQPWRRSRRPPCPGASSGSTTPSRSRRRFRRLFSFPSRSSGCWPASSPAPRSNAPWTRQP